MNRSRLLHSMRPVVSRKRGLRCHRIPAASGAALLQISVLMLCAMMIMMIGSQEVSAASWDPEQEISTDDAGTLRVKQEISTDEGTEEQWYPSIAVDNGHVYVAWEDEGDGDWDIYYTYFDGSDWQPEQEISTDDAAEDQRYPSIAAENGRVYVAWEDEGDGDWDIYYRYFDGSDWQPEQEISMMLGQKSRVILQLQ